MSDFRCWDPDNCEEEDAKLMKASNAEWAAERYMELEWPNLDYISVMTVHVLDEQGVLTVWEVRAEPAVTFQAVLLEDDEEEEADAEEKPAEKGEAPHG